MFSVADAVFLFSSSSTCCNPFSSKEDEEISVISKGFCVMQGRVVDRCKQKKKKKKNDARHRICNLVPFLSLSLSFQAAPGLSLSITGFTGQSVASLLFLEGVDRRTYSPPREMDGIFHVRNSCRGLCPCFFSVSSPPQTTQGHRVWEMVTMERPKGRQNENKTKTGGRDRAIVWTLYDRTVLISISNSELKNLKIALTSPLTADRPHVRGALLKRRRCRCIRT